MHIKDSFWLKTSYRRFAIFLYATESDCDLSGRGFVPDTVATIVMYNLWEYFVRYIRDYGGLFLPILKKFTFP